MNTHPNEAIEWPILVAELAGLAVLILVIFLVFRFFRERRKIKGAIPCPNCGYDLRGQRNTSCPECGREFALQDLIQSPSEK